MILMELILDERLFKDKLIVVRLLWSLGITKSVTRWFFTLCLPVVTLAHRRSRNNFLTYTINIFHTPTHREHHFFLS